MFSTVFLRDVRVAFLVVALLLVPWLVPAGIGAVVPEVRVPAGWEEVRSERGVARFVLPPGFERVLGTNRDARLYERGGQRVGVRIVGGISDPEVAVMRYVSNQIENARLDAPLADVPYQGYRCSILMEGSEGECSVITHEDYLVAITSTSDDGEMPIPVKPILDVLRVDIS